MQIELSFDPSVANAPAGFTTAIEDAAEFYDTLFSNPITVTLDVGWGEIDGSSVSGDDLGESLANYQGSYTYSQVRNALIATDTGSYDASAVASLPASSPLSSSAQMYMSDAEALALGLVSGNPDSPDGWVGFSNDSAFTTNPDDRAVSGEYDLIGVAEHEISEDLGRVADLNTFDGTRHDPAYTPIDLFRYAGANDRQLTTGAPSYFSVNSGETDLDNFNNYQTGDDGDLGDWAPSAGNDSYDDNSNEGVENPVTPPDIQVMEALGYQLASNPTVVSGQTFEIAASESFNNVTVQFGGVMLIDFEGTATDATISGTEDDSGTASGTTIASGGTETVLSGGTASGSVIQAGGTQQVASGGAATNTDFAGDGVLAFVKGATISGTVTNFTSGDQIDFQKQAVTSVTYSGGVLTLKDGGTTEASFDVSGPTSASQFTLTSDGQGGTDIGVGATPPEVFFTNPSTGDTGYWLFDGSGNVSGFQDVGDMSAAYTGIATGPFDSSGTTEVLWQNPSTGDTGYWTIANGAETGFHDMAQANTAYSIVGIGDFNDVGYDEVLFEDKSTGDTGYWTTSNGAVTGFHDFASADTAYTILGVGDFDGSGHSEVLFQNLATGDTGYWTTNAAGQVTGFHDLGQANTAYTLVGIGDFDGSSASEPLFENKTTGDTGYWTFNSSGNIASFDDLGSANTAYTVVGVGDYDGSGHDEVLWENKTTADIGYWTTNTAGQVTGFHDLGTANLSYNLIGGAIIG